MAKGIPGITFEGLNRNFFMDSEYSMYVLPFRKDAEFFSSFDNYVKFVKDCERMVRTSEDYKKYKSELIEAGLNFCQVMPNITVDNVGVNGLEMHHGPILTLFDIVSIMVDSEVEHGRHFTTFSLADKCLQEHFDGNIQTVMLSETAHQEVHDNNIFLNMNMANGNLNRFLQKYGAGLRDEHVYMINNYIEISLKNDSTDNNVLKLRDTITNFGAYR